MVQIDGLSRPELERLLEMGRMPVLAGLVQAGRLSLGDWQPLVPPCTPASQAGILHGRNDGIPGFRWFEKQEGRLFVANHAGDSAEIERRMSGGKGLLADGGVSIGNLLAGDATYSHLTMATIAAAVDPSDDGEVGSDGHDHGRPDHVSFTFRPRIWATIVIDAIRETLDEIRGARRQRRGNVRPRMRRGWRYAIERVLTNVPLRILTAELVRAEIRAPATTRSPITAAPAGPRRGEQPSGSTAASAASSGRWTGHPLRTASSSCRTTASRSARRIVSVSAGRSASRSAP